MTINFEATKHSTVWKYDLEPGPNHLDLPIGAQILAVGEQGHQIVCWATVEPQGAEQPRHIHVTGTGVGFPVGQFTFIGTVQSRSGLVFHVAEEVRA
jgi:hypothetical protein